MDRNQLVHILVKRLLGRATEEEMRETEEWLSEGEENRRLWERLCSEAFWKKTAGERNRELRRREWEKLARKTVGKQMRGWWLKVAAVVVLALTGGLAVWVLQRESGEMTEMAPLAKERIEAGTSKAIVELADGQQVLLSGDTTLVLEADGGRLVNRRDTLNLSGTVTGGLKGENYHTIRIPRGGEYVARLEDGTVVHLNSDTELKVPVSFSGRERNVWLKGEAYFDVAKDKERVFTVHTAKADIEVLASSLMFGRMKGRKGC